MAHLFQYLIGANIICFVAFAIDKFIASCKLKCRRIPEETLFGLMMLGPAGALCGMLLCWHKVRKASFWIRVIFCLCLHLYLFAQFVQKKMEMITNPGAFGINNVETPTMDTDIGGYSNMDSLEDDVMPPHPDL